MSRKIDRTPSSQNVSTPADGGWRKLLKAFLITEHTVAFVKHLSLVSLLVAAVGSYFQYVSWREEQNIAQYKEDFGAANKFFEETSNFIAAPLTLQQLLYNDYKIAIAKGEENNKDAFFPKSAKEVYIGYSAARRSLREHIEILSRKAEIYIDWASNENRDVIGSRTTAVDTINEYSLANLDCDSDTPGIRFDELAKISIKNPVEGRAALTLDWRSAKHQLVALYTCLERMNGLLEIPRQWASGSAITPAQKAQFSNDDSKFDFGNKLDELVGRLNAFMLLTTWRIDDIRMHYQTKGFLCHIGLSCPRQTIIIASKADLKAK